MPEDTHFAGKKPLNHVIEKQTMGLLKSAEIHGVELPGYLAAGTDAMKETALILLLFWTILYRFGYSPSQLIWPMTTVLVALMIWKTGRAALLGWQHLERMHHVMEEERWEIEHHRRQERQELIELYGAKGFQGKLLDDVVDVLMSDNDRLLRVMLEEELGLTLEKTQHPLLQGSGAMVGVLLAGGASLLCSLLFPPYGIILATVLIISISAIIAAKKERNRIIPAAIWTLGIAAAAFGFLTFLLDYLV